jgi:hypothetical protein
MLTKDQAKAIHKITAPMHARSPRPPSAAFLKAAQKAAQARGAIIAAKYRRHVGGKRS